jgi:alkyl hydroperoxide reductase subunit AhpC
MTVEEFLDVEDNESEKAPITVRELLTEMEVIDKQKIVKHIMENMTSIGRHKIIHDLLDYLVAMYLASNDKALPSTTTVLELMQWSHSKTIKE